MAKVVLRKDKEKGYAFVYDFHKKTFKLVDYKKATVKEVTLEEMIDFVRQNGKSKTIHREEGKILKISL